MLIEKDYVLIFFILMFVFILFNYFKIYFEKKKQLEFFINTLGHDFNVSVLAQIRALELVNQYNASEMIENIKEVSVRSLDMIKLLTDTYKLETGETVLKYEYSDVNNLIKNSYNKFLPLIEKRGLTFKYNIHFNTIYSDNYFLEKALNFIAEASVNYAQKGSLISISSFQKGKNTIIKIIYNGKSLSGEEYSRMFGKNSRFSTVGYGIQMYFARKIIEFHGGITEFKSNKNQNEFSIFIPNDKYSNLLLKIKSVFCQILQIFLIKHNFTKFNI